MPNRWKFRFPSWRRYEDRNLDALYSNPRRLDPFSKNKVKGDMPVFGKRGFLILAGSSDTLIDTRRAPTTNAVSTANPDSFEFFGDGEQASIRQSFRFSLELFRGSAGFKPVDFSLKITPEFNINYLSVRENNVVRIDPREGTTRVDSHVGLQEMFFETRFGTNSSRLFRRARRDFDDRGDAEYDFTALRFGIQRMGYLLDSGSPKM